MLTNFQRFGCLGQRRAAAPWSLFGAALYLPRHGRGKVLVARRGRSQFVAKIFCFNRNLPIVVSIIIYSSINKHNKKTLTLWSPLYSKRFDLNVTVAGLALEIQLVFACGLSQLGSAEIKEHHSHTVAVHFLSTIIGCSR